MASSSASPRCSPSPLLRRKRDATVATQQCVQVQWRFLQHQNPVPPSFTSSGTRPAAPSQSKRLAAATAPPSQQRPTDQLGRAHEDTGSPSKLYQLFASPEAEAEINDERRLVNERQVQQQQRRAHGQCRVLDDILGETQRKAMLSRIMADMEALALQSVSTPQRMRHRKLTDASQSDAGGLREVRDGFQDVTTRRKRSSGIMTLRNTLSPSAASASSSSSDTSAISLLPQRRMSTLGSIKLGMPRRDALLCLSEDNDEEGEEDDDDDNDDVKAEAKGNRSGRADRALDGTPERIAMTELRKLRKREQQHLDAHEWRSEPPYADADAHVCWQKSSRVTLAHDIPPALRVHPQLVNASSSASSNRQQQPSPLHAATGDLSVRSTYAASVPPTPTTRGSAALSGDQQSLNNLMWRSQWPVVGQYGSSRSLVSPGSPLSPRDGTTSSSSGHARARDADLSTSVPPPIVSPRDAHKVQAPYGAWYLPRQQWWELREKEQQALAKKFPVEAARVLAVASSDERHCHHGPHTERSHKPSVAVVATSMDPSAASPLARPDERVHEANWPTSLRN